MRRKPEIMQKSDFNFELPKELIAQTPCEPRDASRLLCLSKTTGAVRHQHFYDLPNLLKQDDLLVINNSKVLPARLIGQKEQTGAVCELLLLKENQKDEWECLARPGKRLHTGNRVVFGDGSLSAEILRTSEGGTKHVRFTYNTATLYEKLDEFGKMPLPPYIETQLEDKNRYQTVYAKTLGSAAAPTAGLHFTEELLQILTQKNIQIAQVTLHVGLGTFRPVQEENILNHHMHKEWYSIDEETVKKIQQTKQKGGRVIAVGTTTCRTLEAAAATGVLKAGSAQTDIFIYPGYQFRVIDALITNFHLPESTLLMLVSAFCGYEHTMKAYETAVKEQYRFFSFGDAMLIE